MGIPVFFLLTTLDVLATSVRLEYKFYKNFGQRFIDYSGNGFDGINGGLLCQDKNDSLITDRGVMLTRDEHRITIPIVNSAGELLFNSNSFSIILWIKITKESNSSKKNLFIRFIDENKYLRIVHYNSFEVDYFDSTLKTVKHSSPCTLGKF